MLETESDSSPFLPKQDDSNRDTSQTTSQRLLFASVRILTCLLAVWGLVSLVTRTPCSKPSHDVYRPETLPLGLNLCDCGSTMKEALSRNCVYDTLSAAWLPPFCRDDNLTFQFDRAGPGPNGAWAFFRDENGTIALTTTEIGALAFTGGSFWVSNQWHIAHCLFIWQKLVRMRETGVIMEARFDSLMHAQHCTELILGPWPHYSFLIEVPVMTNASDEPMRLTGVSKMELIHDKLNLSLST